MAVSHGAPVHFLKPFDGLDLTYKPLIEWGRALHDENLAQAILYRVLKRGRLLTLDGLSLRTKHLGLDDPTSWGINSGGQNFRN